jgi:hypothetical protein
VNGGIKCYEENNWFRHDVPIYCTEFVPPRDKTPRITELSFLLVSFIRYYCSARPPRSHTSVNKHTALWGRSERQQACHACARRLRYITQTCGPADGRWWRVCSCCSLPTRGRGAVHRGPANGNSPRRQKMAPQPTVGWCARRGNHNLCCVRSSGWHVGPESDRARKS